MNQDDYVYQADIADLVQAILLIADIRASGIELEPQEIAALSRRLDLVGRRKTRYHLANLIDAATTIALTEGKQLEVEEDEIEVYVRVRDKVMTR